MKYVYTIKTLASQSVTYTGPIKQQTIIKCGFRRLTGDCSSCLVFLLSSLNARPTPPFKKHNALKWVVTLMLEVFINLRCDSEREHSGRWAGGRAPLCHIDSPSGSRCVSGRPRRRHVSVCNSRCFRRVRLQTRRPRIAGANWGINVFEGGRFGLPSNRFGLSNARLKSSILHNAETVLTTCRRTS